MKSLIFILLFYMHSVMSVASPVDISLIVVDFKYNSDEGVKICEVQPLRSSRLMGYYHTHANNPSYIKKFLGDWFHEFNMPKWADGRNLGDSELKRVYYEKFNIINNPLYFLRNDKEILAHKEILPADENDLRSYTGMMYLSARLMNQTQKIRALYPSLIFIDEAITPLYGDKLQVNTLFSSNEELDEYRPKWGAYQKKYHPQLADTILTDIGSDIVVIKPRRAARGYGVLIVHAHHLDATLKFILTKSSKLKNHKDPSYSYWYKESSENFIIEEFISSDPLEKGEKLFDPTYRFIVILHYDMGEARMELIDGYAKLPKKGIYESGSLNKRHKSCGEIPYYAPIQESHYSLIQNQLYDCLRIFYSELMK